MAPGEIHLADFPFGGGGGSKLRPVLMLTGPVGSVPEVLVAYISSVMPLQILPSDLILDPHSTEHTATNLKSVSVVRLHKLATIHRRSVMRLLGHISPATALEMAARLRVLLAV